jgi:hypothetical protein
MSLSSLTADFASAMVPLRSKAQPAVPAPPSTHGAIAIVGHTLDEKERAAGTGAFVKHLFIRGAFDFPGAALDGAVDRVIGHRLPFGIGHGLTQARVAPQIAAAHAGGHGELFDEFREELAAFGVEGSFFVLDRGPFRMAAHTPRPPWEGLITLVFACGPVNRTGIPGASSMGRGLEC